jgi:elongation factor G
VGYFHWEYDHLQEVPEKLTNRVLQTVSANENA